MPKGDAKKAQTKIDTESNIATEQFNRRNAETDRLAENRKQYYDQASAQATQDYGNIMGKYSGIGDQYGQMAKTGGYSQQDLANLRSRGNSPIAAMYQNANRDVDRQRVLGGGGGANYMATKAKMARDQSSAMSDAGVNTEAQIAQMRQQGQLAGMQGQLGAASGMGSMYSATPGAAALYGGQEIASQGLRNDIYGGRNQMGLGLIGSQQNQSRVPSNFQQGMSNVGSALGLGGQIGGMLNLFGGGGGGGGGDTISTPYNGGGGYPYNGTFPGNIPNVYGQVGNDSGLKGTYGYPYGG